MSVFELWVDLTDGGLGSRLWMTRDSVDPLVEEAEFLAGQGDVTGWYVFEKRTSVSFHIAACSPG